MTAQQQGTTLARPISGMRPALRSLSCSRRQSLHTLADFVEPVPLCCTNARAMALRLAPLTLLRVAGLRPRASSRLAAHHHRLLLFAAPARPWRLLSLAARPRALATAAAEADGAGDGFFAEESTSWGSLGVSDRVASALRGAGLARPSLVQVKALARSAAAAGSCDTRHVLDEMS